MKPTLMRMAQYTRWSDRKIFDLMLSEEIRDEKLIALTTHLIDVLDVWLSRMDGTEVTRLAGDRDSLEKLTDRHEAIHRRLIAAISRLSPIELEDTCRYSNSENEVHENRLTDLFVHLVNHSTHHRAQMSTRLRELGHEPPATDYIFYLRETERRKAD